MTPRLELALARFSHALYGRARAKKFPRIRQALGAGGQRPRWHTMSEWLRAAPDRPDLMSYMGPRWNCHALLGLTDIFETTGTIRVRPTAVMAEIPHWTIVVYDAKLRTIASIGMLDVAGRPDNTVEIELAAGRYLLASRSYGTSTSPALPEIEADGTILVEGRETSGERDAYEDVLAVIARSGSPWRWLLNVHSYLFVKHQERLEPAFVERMFLPVGNPETRFQYGAIRHGERLQVRRLASASAFVTFYDRQSRPVHWQALAEHQSIRAAETGTYVIRTLESRSDGSLPVVDIIRACAGS